LELRDRLLVPLLRALKAGPLFKQNDVGAFDAKADADLVADGSGYASLAKDAEPSVYFGPLHFGQRHV